MTSITGVSFRAAWTGRRRERFGARDIGFLGPKQLVRNKRATARPKDLADLALLAEIGVTRRSLNEDAEVAPGRRRTKLF